jgi:hypothetical protein
MQISAPQADASPAPTGAARAGHGRYGPVREGGHLRLGPADEAADQLAAKLFGVLVKDVSGEAEGALDQAELGIVAHGIEVGQGVDASRGELGLEPGVVEQ